MSTIAIIAIIVIAIVVVAILLLIARPAMQRRRAERERRVAKLEAEAEGHRSMAEDHKRKAEELKEAADVEEQHAGRSRGAGRAGPARLRPCTGGGGPGLLTIIYLVIGVFAAGDHGYIQHDTVGEVVLRPARDRALAAGRLLRPQSPHQ